MFYFLLRHRPTRRALRPSRYSYWRQVLSGSQIDPLPFSSRTSSAHAAKEYLPKVDIYAIPIGISSAKRSLTLPADCFYGDFHHRNVALLCPGKFRDGSSRKFCPPRTFIRGTADRICEKSRRGTFQDIEVQHFGGGSRRKNRPREESKIALRTTTSEEKQKCDCSLEHGQGGIPFQPTRCSDWCRFLHYSHTPLDRIRRKLTRTGPARKQRLERFE